MPTVRFFFIQNLPKTSSQPNDSENHPSDRSDIHCIGYSKPQVRDCVIRIPDTVVKTYSVIQTSS
jgi:hypothetical protein